MFRYIYIYTHARTHVFFPEQKNPTFPTLPTSTSGKKRFLPYIFPCILCREATFFEKID